MVAGWLVRLLPVPVLVPVGLVPVLVRPVGLLGLLVQRPKAAPLLVQSTPVRGPVRGPVRVASTLPGPVPPAVGVRRLVAGQSPVVGRTLQAVERTLQAVRNLLVLLVRLAWCQLR